MSIELLPADKKYPKKWHVRINSCDCHPETCCCSDYVVCSSDGERYSTFNNEAMAEDIAELLNSRGQ